MDNGLTVLAELRKCGLTDSENCLKAVTLSMGGGATVRVPPAARVGGGGGQGLGRARWGPVGGGGGAGMRARVAGLQAAPRPQRIPP